MTGAGATAFTNAFHYGYNIGQGTAYTRLEGKNSAGVQKTNYISYTPNSTITPVIVYASDKLYGSGAGISAAAKYLEQQGKQVIAGINADFFVMNTSIPIGLVIGRMAVCGGLYRERRGDHRAADDEHARLRAERDGDHQLFQQDPHGGGHLPARPQLRFHLAYDPEGQDDRPGTAGQHAGNGRRLGAAARALE